jgi:hypothetical protein
MGQYFLDAGRSGGSLWRINVYVDSIADTDANSSPDVRAFRYGIYALRRPSHAGPRRKVSHHYSHAPPTPTPGVGVEWRSRFCIVGSDSAYPAVMANTTTGSAKLEYRVAGPTAAT